MADIPVFVVVPVWNGAEELPDFLSSLKASGDSQRISLVVVDNASADDSLEIIAKGYPEAHIIKNTENRAFAGGCNQGMEYALSQGAEYVFLANQDLSFGAGWLTPLLADFQANPHLGAVQSVIMRSPDKEKYNAYGNAMHYLGYGYARADGQTPQQWRAMPRQVPFFYCSGAAVMYSCAALKIVGLFDGWFFMYHEDTDLSWRLRLAGYDLAIAEESRVYHHYEFSRSIQKFYYIERNRLIILLKNYRLGTLVVLAPMLVVMELGQVLASVVEVLKGGKALTLKEKLRTYAYFLSLGNWRTIWQARRATQRLRRVPDRIIVQRCADVVLFQEFKNPLLTYVANPMTRAYWWVVRWCIVW